MNKKLVFLVGVLAIAAIQAQATGRLSNYDRQIVATCMVLEAGVDGAEGMQAVLNVILNRADGYLHRLVPETIRTGAFSCMQPVWSNRSPNYSPLIRQAQNQRRAYSDALHLIAVMEQGQLWDNTHGATHYHANYVRPYWISDMRYVTTVGSHYFYIRRGRELAAL